MVCAGPAPWGILTLYAEASRSGRSLMEPLENLLLAGEGQSMQRHMVVRAVLASPLFAAVLGMALLASTAQAAEPYRVGRGKADITGPPVVKMLGYVRPNQITKKGFRLRQYARTFIVAEPKAIAGWRS